MVTISYVLPCCLQLAKGLRSHTGHKAMASALLASLNKRFKGAFLLAQGKESTVSVSKANNINDPIRADIKYHSSSNRKPVWYLDK